MASDEAAAVRSRHSGGTLCETAVRTAIGTRKGPDVESRTPQDVLQLAKESGAEFVDVRFCDLPGVMQHLDRKSVV